MYSMTKRIHLISGPRNISTALMYSFGNRNDTSIVDEPMYAHYLHTHPDIIHPSHEEILKSQRIELNQILENVIFGSYPTDNVFIKNMAHHLDGVDWSFLTRLDNVFLIRSPERLIASFAKVITHPTMLDIGLKLEYEIFNYLQSKGQPFCILDSGEVLKNPEAVLTKLCAFLDMEMDAAMLQWTAGPRHEDGVWAKHWYHNVHLSTGFKRPPDKPIDFPEYLRPLLSEALHYYDLLYAHSIKA
ncbi:MAG: sulfotransferase family protein [Saprospiraceae bacterium]|nr:sulfotransferase family protein [Saprospiraceae bacterium]